MPLGEKIRRHRKELGLNQTEFARHFGVNTTAVSKWERGEVENIPLSKVKRMSEIFGVRLSYLIDDDIPLQLEGHEEISAEAQRIGAAFDRAEEYPKNIVRTTLEPYMEKGQARTG